MSLILYDILFYLSVHDAHIRTIASALKTNPMTITRKVKVLVEENVLDYRIEGKNKVYFIKDSAEAKIQLSILEHLRLLHIIKKYPKIRFITQKILQDKDIKLAIIFGSYARGTPTINSDVDIYIESEDIKIIQKLQEIDSKISIKNGIFDQENLLIREIIQNHIIIKGVDRYNELIYKKTWK